jgi:hypothetical protein
VRAPCGTKEAGRAFQLHLLERRVSWSSFNQAVCALRFFYRTTLGQSEQLPVIPFGKRPKTLPSVLSPDEVLRLLNTAPPGRDRVLLQVAYGCGLRLGIVPLNRLPCPLPRAGPAASYALPFEPLPMRPMRAAAGGGVLARTRSGSPYPRGTAALSRATARCGRHTTRAALRSVRARPPAPARSASFARRTASP